MYIGARILVSRFAIFTALEGEDVEAFWLMIDGIGERKRTSTRGNSWTVRLLATPTIALFRPGLSGRSYALSVSPGACDTGRVNTGETSLDEFRRERRRGDTRLSPEGRAILKRITSGDLADEFAAALHDVSTNDPALGPEGATLAK